VGVRVVVLQTERLVLSEVAEDDWAFMLELLNSPGFLLNIGDRGVRTEDEARAYIRDRVRGSYQANGFGMWLVLEKASGVPVGLAGLVKRDGLEDPDVGYAFAEPAWGRGYAQESAAAVMRHAREKLGIGRLAAITALDNHASMAVLRKVGFREQGVIRLPGVETDSTYFLAE
jgi:RimJ/RimL family protein N-acetyltransferase